MVEKEIEKIVAGESISQPLPPTAEFCLHCGERQYSTVGVSRLQQSRAKLACHEVADLQLLGQSFQTAI